MTEKELSYKSNKELSNLLDTSIKNIEYGLKNLIVDDDIKDIVNDNIKLYKEISKRLKIEPHITFEDEAFDM